MKGSVPAGAPRATVMWMAAGEALVEGYTPVRDNGWPRPTTLRDIFERWGEEWVWRNIEIDDEGEWLAKAIRHRTVILVCNGSYKPRESLELGAAAWILECQVNGRRVRGAVQMTAVNASAYRSELMGIYMGLALVKAVCTLHRVQSGRVAVRCDNEKAIELSAVASKRVAPCRKHTDVLRAIRMVHMSLEIDVEFGHIYGHQDDHVFVEDLMESTGLAGMVLSGSTGRQHSKQ